MKKWLIVALIVAAVVVLGAMPILLTAGIEHIWGHEGLEQFGHVMPFVGAAICFAAPLAFYLTHRWRQTHKPTDYVSEMALKRVMILMPIGFILLGLGQLTQGLEEISILPPDPAFVIGIGFNCMTFFPLVAALIVLLVDRFSAKAEQQHADRPQA